MEHSVITDPDIHEPKGASTATVGQILVANGDGTTSWVASPFSTVQVGWYDYDDSATVGAPIALTTPGTYYDLTNDGLGVNTQLSYALSDSPNIYDTTTQRFDFSNLAVGDTLEVRADVLVTTTNANTAISLVLELNTGTGSVFNIPVLVAANIKTASTVNFVHERSFYIGSESVRTSPGRLRMTADTAGATVVVNGWYVRVIKR